MKHTKAKKFISLALALILTLALIPAAGIAADTPKAGDRLGDVLHTDIKAYIDGNQIPGFNIGGYTYVIAEDLKNYGFNVVWNAADRTLSVTRNAAKAVTPLPVTENGGGKTGSIAFPYVYTDVKTFVEGKEVISYNINGKTIIRIDDLEIYGKSAWNGTARTISLTLGKSAPKITQRGEFTDEPVIIGEGTDFPLDGILSIPNDTIGKVPAVVIVHGSGPGDMDGTRFANKPYRDIAEYLASKGIAVVRYNKRLHTHVEKMMDQILGGELTVYEETIEDAILAAEFLKADPRIDENKVFMIGHSLGGMLAPRIHAEGGDFAGLILLAGSPRFFLEITKDHNALYVKETMEGAERDAVLAHLEETWEAQIEILVSLPDDIAKATHIEAGMSAYYFKDLHQKPTAAYLEKTDVPFLILQGEADLQITTEADFAKYKELLGDRPNVTFKLYEGLNHYFMPGSRDTGYTRLDDEYAIESRVDAQVLADIAEWIKEQ